MVKFLLKSNNGNVLTYEYYPEGDFDSKAGIITFNTESRTISVDVPAVNDFISSTTIKELNDMRDAINQMRVENGEPPITEDELPTATEDESWYYYGDHAMNKIWKSFLDGKILSEGTVAWY